MNISIVLGAGFGDEGKGQCVHSLSNSNTLVIRFSGGHQCGHTVITREGQRHVFSQFGSGTFQGASTYLSEYCTAYPIAWQNEYKTLISHSILLPVYFVHPLLMITTPYDLAFNRAWSMVTGHGTCGVGYGTTIQRNEDFYHLYAGDLQNEYIYDNKMALIEHYYEEKIKNLNLSSRIIFEQELESAMENWEEALHLFRNSVKIKCIQDICSGFERLVFEGSQGIMLDQHAGFFPHVTRANTTSKNAFEIIRQIPLPEQHDITTCYVSRCYHTRHGNGPFQEEKKIELINTSDESNLQNDWQGIFRTAKLDFSLLKYAVDFDRISNMRSRKKLIITCMDQLKDTESFLEDFESGKLSALFDEVQFKNQPDWT